MRIIADRFCCNRLKQQVRMKSSHVLVGNAQKKDTPSRNVQEVYVCLPSCTCQSTPTHPMQNSLTQTKDSRQHKKKTCASSSTMSKQAKLPRAPSPQAQAPPQLALPPAPQTPLR